MVFPSPDFEEKICTTAQLAEQLRKLPRPIVFTNGCFDIIHRGHVTYLAQARALGASLIVGLNSDDSVRRQGKGADRPINNQLNRAAVLAALASINLVTWFDSDTPAQLIELIQPDILVKGGDWSVDTIVGSAETLARGGKVYSIPFLFDTSTTATLRKIREQDSKP
ncbi:D-glycero-beta-D-manno-heptose 1-phosphate adenylyltransferase [Neisseriaceae bacterium TC5R-5]|nr:D-glycero-beta-D-manno-heptose 1-phosphate adenylyltransferase [Neisseriaceae bacterium TC5R-5]